MKIFHAFRSLASFHWLFFSGEDHLSSSLLRRNAYIWVWPCHQLNLNDTLRHLCSVKRSILIYFVRSWMFANHSFRVSLGWWLENETGCFAFRTHSHHVCARGIPITWQGTKRAWLHGCKCREIVTHGEMRLDKIIMWNNGAMEPFSSVVSLFCVCRKRDFEILHLHKRCFCFLN